MREQIAPGRFSSPKKRPGPEAKVVDTRQTRPSPLCERVWLRQTNPKRERGSGIIIIMSEFLVVLSQHVRKTGNPIRLLDLLKSCDMKEN